MDLPILLLAIATASVFGLALHAWRLGNEKRDVVLLGVVGSLCGVGTVATAVL